jgi:hypothetical protein
MVGSHSILSVVTFDKIRSIHDLSFPRWNVLHATGPGYIPFNMCHPNISHTSMSHGALLHVILSALRLENMVSSMFGDRVPTLVFQSPHITCISSLGKFSTMS